MNATDFQEFCQFYGNMLTIDPEKKNVFRSKLLWLLRVYHCRLLLSQKGFPMSNFVDVEITSGLLIKMSRSPMKVEARKTTVAESE